MSGSRTGQGLVRNALVGLVEWAYIAIFAWLAIAGPGPVSIDRLIARATKRDEY